MKKFYCFISLLFILSNTSIYAQLDLSKASMNVGVGNMLMGSGDLRANMLEAELSYDFTRLLSGSVNLAIGRSHSNDSHVSGFVQRSGSVFFAPFKSNRLKNLKIGGGITFLSLSEIYENALRDNLETEEYNVSYATDNRDTYGYNIILKDTHPITSTISIGGKLFLQSFKSGEVNRGFQLLFGAKLK